VARKKRTRTVVITEEAPLPIGPYSQAIKANGLVFVSGQIPMDPQSGELVRGEMKEATLLVLKNIEAVLKAADSSLGKTVKLTVYVKNLENFGAVNEAFEEVFTEAPPARETVQVSRLPKDVDIEISAVALSDS
jgi:2-iminobutanoate/2-iminopropanoate deaminase